MKKVLLNILKTIVGVPLALLGAICMIPLSVLYILIYLPAIVIGDIWFDGGCEEDYE